MQFSHLHGRPPDSQFSATSREQIIHEQLAEWPQWKWIVAKCRTGFEVNADKALAFVCRSDDSRIDVRRGENRRPYRLYSPFRAVDLSSHTRIWTNICHFRSKEGKSEVGRGSRVTANKISLQHSAFRISNFFRKISSLVDKYYFRIISLWERCTVETNDIRSWYGFVQEPISNQTSLFSNITRKLV